MNCISCGANVKKINKAKRCKKCEDKRKVIIEKIKETNYGKNKFKKYYGYSIEGLTQFLHSCKVRDSYTKKGVE